MYKKIICPVDGSETSNVGMQEAIRLAKNQSAKLRFLHIIDTYLPIVVGVGTYVPVNIGNILQENAEGVIEKANIAAKKAGVTTDARIIGTVGGHPSTYIVKQAMDWQADIIVMGTHGLRGFDRLVTGSDAEDVVRTSSIPVMLVNSTVKKA